MNGTALTPCQIDRAEWIGVLALADAAWLEERWRALPARPAFTHLRAPEAGLAMLRGRAGGTGDPFNIGEMTMTRCSVCLQSGQIGHGFVGGRHPRHAELAALFDAMMQHPDLRDRIAAEVIAPARTREAARRQAMAEAAAPTRVEFFTMPRGQG